MPPSRSLFQRIFIAALFLSPALLQAIDEPAATAEDLPRIPPKTIEEQLASFAIKPGFEIELAASEPLIEDPIAISFAADGAMFVVEMRGYSERREEELGRVSRLVDSDGDGLYETATVYASGMKWPTGAIPWMDGVFVVATPDLLFFRDQDGDGVSDEREVIFTGFGGDPENLNVQALVNSLTWGPDQRIYAATAPNGGKVRRPDQSEAEAMDLRGADFSFDPHALDLRRESGTAQYGLTFDDFGQRYVCSNSRHVMAVMYSSPWNERLSLPSALVNIPVDGPAAEVYRTSGVEPWRKVRTRWRVQGLVGGPVEGGGRDSGYFTSASGLCIYRGDAFPESYRGNLFVGDVGGNLVHRKIIERSSEKVELTARRPSDEQDVEFLTSTDNWFRPVMCVNGPDGALYIVDMYRETIEHPRSLPETIKRHLDLNSGNTRGRIWRVVPDEFESASVPDLTQLNTEKLVKRLATSNGWERDMVSMELHARQDAEALPALRQFLEEEHAPASKYRAWQTLGALSQKSISMNAAADSKNAEIRRLGLQQDSNANLTTAAEDPDAWVRFEAALVSHDAKPDMEVLRTLLLQSREDHWTAQATLSSAQQHDLLGELMASLSDWRDAAQFLSMVPRRALQEDDLAALRPHFDAAAKEIQKNPSSPSSIVLVRLDSETSLDTFWNLVDSGSPTTASSAFEEILTRDPAWQKPALSRWATLSPRLRESVLNRLKSTEILDALEAETLTVVELPFAIRTKLRKVTDPRVEVLLGEAVVLNRAEALAEYRPALDLAADASRGAAVFAERCALCHQPKEDGSTIGPGVDSFRSQGKAMLLENILSPNREVAPQYFVWQAQTESQTHLGMITAENSERLTLQNAGGLSVDLERSDLTRLINTNVSLMPVGLEAGLRPQQMADLIEYLVNPNVDSGP